MRLLPISIAFLGGIVCSNVCAEYDEDMAVLTKGLPEPAAAFVYRYVECTHWSGEEPFDKERAIEINTALNDLRCNALEQDEDKLLKTYKSNPKVLDAISKARELYY